MLTLQNSERLLHMYLISLQVWRHNPGRSLMCWRQKYGEAAQESSWGQCGRLEEIQGTVRRALVSCRHQTRDAGVAVTTTPKAAPQNNEILVSLRKSGAWCSGNTQPWCAGWTHMPIFSTAPVNHQPCYCASTPLVCWLNENYPWFWLFLIWLNLVRQIRN